MSLEKDVRKGNTGGLRREKARHLCFHQLYGVLGFQIGVSLFLEVIGINIKTF